MSKRIAFVGDLHLGAPIKNPSDEINCLMDNLKEQKLDIVVLLGDIFHKKISLDSIESKLASTLLSFLKYELDATVIIVKGTITHDYDQLKNFYGLQDDKFFIVETYSHLSIGDLDFLVIPEEVIKEDSERYYRSLLINDDLEYLVYDFIIGHGTFDCVPFVKATIADMDTSKYTLNSVLPSPILNSKLFKLHSNGPMMFGHIHSKINYKDSLYYPGSWSRWTHDTDNEIKSFIIVDYYECGHELEEVVNTKASKFETVSISETMLSADVNDLANNLISRYKDIDSLKVSISKEVPLEFSERIGQLKKLLMSYESITVEDTKRRTFIQQVIKDSANVLNENVIADINLSPKETLINAAKEHGIDEEFINFLFNQN